MMRIILSRLLVCHTRPALDSLSIELFVITTIAYRTLYNLSAPPLLYQPCPSIAGMIKSRSDLAMIKRGRVLSRTPVAYIWGRPS